MKRIILLIVALPALLWGQAAGAAACTATSLSDYVALGSSGCTIGSLGFSDFQLNAPQSGAVASTAITVDPVTLGATLVGLSFGVSPGTSGGLFYDNLISYRVTGIAASVVGATVDFTGSSATGDAAVSVLSTLCLGGLFLGPDVISGCNGTGTLNLAVIDIGLGPDPAYTLPFAAVGSLAVVTDIAYDSGSGFVPGSASTLASAINLFDVAAAVTPVPEPSPILLLAVGGALIALAHRRRPCPR